MLWRVWRHMQESFMWLQTAISCSFLVVTAFARRTAHSIIYRVIRKTLREFRPLRCSSRDGHANGEHVNRGRDTPSFCPTFIIIESIVPFRNIGCLWVLSTSVYRLLRTAVHSSFCPLYYNNIIIESIVPFRNIGCLWVLSTSVYRLLRTAVHSSFCPLP
jgi:hypothetical protein